MKKSIVLVFVLLQMTSCKQSREVSAKEKLIIEIDVLKSAEMILIDHFVPDSLEQYVHQNYGGIYLDKENYWYSQDQGRVIKVWLQKNCPLCVSYHELIILKEAQLKKLE